MKAVCYRSTGAAGETIKIEQLPTPEPSEGEVLIRIAACGLNPADGYIRRGAAGPMAFPMVIPGFDGAGVIEAVGAGVERKVGERVWIYNGQWRRPFGTAAEYIALPQHLAVPLTDNVPFEQGAAVGIPARTAHFALNIGKPLEGKTILVSGGAGATAFAAIQLAKFSGARVITSVSSAYKANIAAMAGADHIINYKEQDILKEVSGITNGKGVDLIVEVNLGANLDIDIQMLKLEGFISVYGSMGNYTPTLPVRPLLFQQASMRFINCFDIPAPKNDQAIKDITTALEAKALVPHIWRTYSLSDAVQAHEALEKDEQVGKIILST